MARLRNSVVLFFLLCCRIASATDYSDDPAATRSRAIDSLKQKIATGLPDSSLFKAYYQLANIYSKIVPEASLEYCKKAEVVAKKLKDDVLLSQIFSVHGMVLKNGGKYDEAIALHLEALRVNERIRDTFGMAVCSNDLGVLHKTMGKFSQALPYYEKALHYCTLISFDKGIAMCLNNIGTIYNEMRDDSKAIEYYSKALTKAKAIKSNSATAIALNNIGEVYYRQKRFAEALTYFMETLEFDKLGGDKYGNVITLINIANSHREVNQFEQAEKYYLEALGIAKEINAWFELAGVYANISELETRRGNHKKAFDYFKLQQAYKDSVFNEENQRKVDELETRYETEKKDQNIQLLTKQNQVIELSNERKRVTIRLSSAALGLTFVLLLVIFFMYRQKQEVNRRLVLLDKEKNEFLGIAAHDLKNPLQTIIGFCQMQVDYFDKLTKEKILKYTGNIELSARRMIELISNLLDINSIEQGKIKSQPESFDFPELIQKNMRNFEYAAAQKNITIHFEPHEITSLPVFTDPYLLTQIFENLLSNGLKYSPPGTTVTVMLHHHALANQCGFSIQDEGPGMTEDDQKKLFGKFTRLSARPTGGESSNGLGLSIVKKLSEFIHAKVTWSSETGKGTVFTVMFPTIADQTR